jgi:[acyl-carrier-protein] S-malonyltransferase
VSGYRTENREEVPMSRAFVFPGQGAQTIGMGRELAEAYPAARAVFDEVDEALGERLSALIWNGDKDELQLTANAQPALMATSLAAFRALEAEGVNIADAACVAGHSLGEYSALAAAGSLRIGDCARLLRIRGQAMQEAVPVGQGAMAALLGLSYEEAASVAEAAAEGAVCAAANDNDPSQVVISGDRQAVDRAIDLAKERGAKRAVLLPVSAPFHCALMRPAAERMREALAETVLNAPSVPIVVNVTAAPEDDPDRLRELLVEQVTGLVRWRESVLRMSGMGVSEYWEIGAGKALSGMIRRIDRNATSVTIGHPDDVRAACNSLRNGADDV